MSAADRERPAVDGALGEAASRHLSFRVDLFVDPGHRHAKCRADFQKSLGEILDEGTVGEGDAVVEQGEIDVARGDVGKRKE